MLTSAEKDTKYVKKMIESYISSPVMKSFIAGSLSGTCSTIIFQPLDLVKTRIQSPVALGKRSSGIAAVVVNVMRNETLLGFWKGVAPSLSRTVPGIGVYFSSLHWLRSNFGSADPSAMDSVCMGATARCISGASLLPFTVIKTRFESGFFGYSGIKDALVSIYRLEGAKGLYSGLSATLLRDAPFSGIYLMFYTKSKKFVSRCEGWETPGPMVNFSCGIVSGCFAALLTQPFDVIKTHMQLYPDRFSNVKSVSVHIYEQDGASGFLRGLLPRILRRSLMAATAWTVYEQVMKSVGLK